MYKRQGLDSRYGAGQLNIYNSYNILAAGEQNSDEDDGAGDGSITDTGFDYDPSFGGDSGSNNTSTYRFSTGDDEYRLTTTLAWNININGGNGRLFSGTATLHDLDLHIYDATNTPTLIASSTSTTDNTETIWTILPRNRDYELVVSPKAGQPSFDWDYAIAWRLEPVQDTDGDGLSDLLEASIGTDPNLIDSDDDGLSDYDEVAWDGDADTYTPGSDLDPLSTDSDSDDYPDEMEVKTGFDPLNGSETPIWGDLNEDGDVDAADIILLTRAVLEGVTLTTNQSILGNVAPLVTGAPEYNPSGTIDAGDLLILQRKAIGEINY